MTTLSVKTLVAADAASTGPTTLTRIRGVVLMAWIGRRAAWPSALLVVLLLGAMPRLKTLFP
jgi:hypothetical protein